MSATMGDANGWLRRWTLTAAVFVVAVAPIAINSLVLDESRSAQVAVVLAALAFGSAPRSWGVAAMSLPLLAAAAVSDYRWTIVLILLCGALVAVALGEPEGPWSDRVGPTQRAMAAGGVLVAQLGYLVLDVPGKPVLVAGAALAASVAVGRVADSVGSDTVGRVDDSVEDLATRAIAVARDAWARADVRRVTAVVVYGAIGVLAAWVGWQARRDVFYDDTGITMRYASRIADGHGFTYNDGDRTNGASAPLYTLVLAAGSFLGWSLPNVVQAIAVSCYAMAHVLVTWIGVRLAGVWGGALAFVVLLLSDDYEQQALSGMESGFAAVLGLLVIVALLHDRELLGGVLLGLAVVNKLDAGLLAIAVVAAFALADRRFPRRVAVVAVATAAPWFLFSWWYFGSVIPNSATQKLGEVRAEDSDWSPTWILDAFREDVTIAVVGVAAIGLVVALASPRLTPIVRRGVILCGGWSMLHLVAFSTVNLGDTYPWYRAAVVPGAAVVFGWTVVEGFRRAARALGSPAPLQVAMAAVLLVAVSGPLRIAHVVNELTWERTDYPGSSVDALRRDAGRYIAARAEPGEVVRTCFGWVAFEAIDQPIDELCPLNTRRPVDDPTWFQETVVPSTDAAPEIDGAEVVATFTTEFPEDGTSYVYRATGER